MNKTAIKIIPVLLTLSLNLPAVSVCAAVTNDTNSNLKTITTNATKNSFKDVKYDITTNKDNLSTVTFTYPNGEVQTLEEKNVNGKTQLISTAKGKSVVIEKGTDNDIYVNGVKQNIVITKIVPNLKASRNNLLTSYSPDRDVPGWTYVCSQKWNTSLDYGNASLTVGIIVSCLGGPITGIVTSVVSYLISQGATTVWYVKDQYYDDYNSTHIREYDSFYEDSKYRDFINESYWEYYSKRQDY